MDNFIKEYRGVLSGDFCKAVIDKFECDPRKIDGRTGAGWNSDIKRSTDLKISDYWEWKEEDSVFRDSLNGPIQDFYNGPISACYQHIGNSLDTGYNVQRTEPGEFYSWHNDAAAFSNPQGVFMRIFTFIWYLNDIRDGGETEFADGTMITPEEGKLVLFPATWVHAHRGKTPASETKYIATGWFYEQY
jgi:hypothetical protein